MDITLYKVRQLPDDLVEAWAQLVRDEPTLDHPLFHPIWARLASAAGNDEVAVLRDAGEPVGFFPFERRGRRGGQPMAARMSDLHGLILRRGVKCDLGQLLHRCNLAVWHFDHVPVEQRWLAPHVLRVEEAPVIDLLPDFESYWRGRRTASPSWIRQLERKRRRIERELGPLRFEWHTADANVLHALATWKREQIRAAHGFDVFRLAWMMPLLQGVVATQDPGFNGALSALYAGKQLIATHVGICNQRCMSSWIPAYDPQLGRYSPGAMLHVELARAAAERGIEQFELGRGINPLKSALGSSHRRLAIGAVDIRPIWRWTRARGAQLRRLAEAACVAGASRVVYRRLRALKPH